MRNRVPIVYLVDSAGVNLPYQDGIFPGQYGAGRIFLLQLAHAPQTARPADRCRDGPCIAGGAYLPALSDFIIMVENTSFMGLGGPNLVKGATGQPIDQEISRRRAPPHAPSGVAHYTAKNDEDCLDMIRTRFRRFPEPTPASPHPCRARRIPRRNLRHAACRSSPALLHRRRAARASSTRRLHRIPAPIRSRNALRRCAPQRTPVAVIANRRGFLKPRIGGIIYTERARKVAYFVELAERLGTPLSMCRMFPASWSAPEAESEGIIRAGAEMVETMSCASVPRIVLTVNHASGAGYSRWPDRASIPTSPSVGPPPASGSWRAIRRAGPLPPQNSGRDG